MKKNKKLSITYQDIKVTIPYFVYDSGKKGKHVVIISGIHGDEINGIQIVHDFMRWFDDALGEDIIGKITCVPIINVLGYKKGKRRIPIDNSDLNRSFFTEEPKGFSSWYAQTLFTKIFSKAHAVIDLHDAGDGDVLAPHSRFFVSNEDSLRMAELLGTNIAIQRKGKKGMLAKHLQKYGIASLTVEIGGNKEFDLVGQPMAQKGLIRILNYFGCISDAYKIPLQNTMCIYSKRYGFRASQRCFIEVKKTLEDIVLKGEEVAVCFDPLTGKRVVLHSPVNGVVFSIWRANSIYTGAKVISFLVTDDTILEEEIFSETYAGLCIFDICPM